MLLLRVLLVLLLRVLLMLLIVMAIVFHPHMVVGIVYVGIHDCW